MQREWPHPSCCYKNQSLIRANKGWKFTSKQKQKKQKTEKQQQKPASGYNYLKWKKKLFKMDDE